MDLQSLANLGEIIGAGAVVASLLYLAIQVRQSTQAQRTENYSRVQERVSSIQSVLSQDGEIAHICARGAADAAALTPLERVRFTWLLYEAFGAFEFMYHTHKTGEMPDEVWQRWSATAAWWLSFPGVRVWWANRPVRFSASFEVFVEATLRDNPTDVAANARWRQFVAAEADFRPPGVDA